MEKKVLKIALFLLAFALYFNLQTAANAQCHPSCQIDSDCGTSDCNITECCEGIYNICCGYATCEWIEDPTDPTRGFCQSVDTCPAGFSPPFYCESRSSVYDCEALGTASCVGIANCSIEVSPEVPINQPVSIIVNVNPDRTDPVVVRSSSNNCLFENGTQSIALIPSNSRVVTAVWCSVAGNYTVSADEGACESSFAVILRGGSSLNWMGLFETIQPDGCSGPGCIPIRSTTTLGRIIGVLNLYVFPIAGLLLLIYLIYGGFLLLTSLGNPKNFQTAKSAITNALAGFLLMFFAYWLVQIVARVLGLTDISSIF